MSGLEKKHLLDLQKNFSHKAMNKELAKAFPAAYPESEAYIKAITDLFASQLPAETSTTESRSRPSREDRERILIALLASRGERLNLAVHIYYALGLKITPAEITNILLLTGVYTGLPNFARALDVIRDTFKLLAEISAQQPHPKEVLIELHQGFALPPPQP